MRLWGKCHSRWGYEGYGGEGPLEDADAESVCIKCVKTHIYIKHLLKMWQSKVAKLTFDPSLGVSKKTFDEQVSRALTLKVSFLVSFSCGLCLGSVL